MASYIPSTWDERLEMLKTVGVSSYRELYRDVPPEMYLDRGLNIPEGLSELEVGRKISAMAAKNREYVHYAELIGVPKWKIMLLHILPSIFPVIITAATGAIASAIMVESAMSFLGFGIQAPDTSWGTLLQMAQKTLGKAPHMAILPGVLIICTVCAFNKLGDLLRLFVEPRAMEEGK